ncbi:MAG: cyclic pyranopterin monophosphate synthase MoaC [Nitrososphaerota archaeon]|nr:cyclic pyranopterin monophosphate synthase MoaC [Candidatus Bathyarchaeota archaeon]MDW8193518.1 cyclic pyranopterin monophosphate synthase MoaC [Nitrososphaerota archaeon]
MAMVDVTGKSKVFREAIASGRIRLKPETIKLIKEAKVEKGDPLYTAKIAGILAAKQTSILVPLCHPLPLTSVKVDVEILDDSIVQVSSTVKTEAQTGVEMEALVATATGLLTIWDMVKQYEKDAEGQYPTTRIEEIRVIKKVKESAVENERKHKET